MLSGEVQYAQARQPSSNRSVELKRWELMWWLLEWGHGVPEPDPLFLKLNDHKEQSAWQDERACRPIVPLLSGLMTAV